jgi:hypothetical protein
MKKQENAALQISSNTGVMAQPGSHPVRRARNWLSTGLALASDQWPQWKHTVTQLARDDPAALQMLLHPTVQVRILAVLLLAAASQSSA